MLKNERKCLSRKHVLVAENSSAKLDERKIQPLQINIFHERGMGEIFPTSWERPDKTAVETSTP